MRKFLVKTIFIWAIYASGQVDVPQIIPSSPSAQEFEQYVDFPMDLSSGLPTINIPLYTIMSKELTLPISLSYHASGLKPNSDTNGAVGLGWHLNANGMVSRTIYGDVDEGTWNGQGHWSRLIPDENSITSNTIQNQTDPQTGLLDNIDRGYIDTQPDVFNYSLPSGEGGKFLFERNSVQSQFLIPQLLPKKPIKVVPSGISFDYFDVIDQNGVQYRFGRSLSSSGVSVKEEYSSSSGAYQENNGWLLTEIISANKSDTLYFEYDKTVTSHIYQPMSSNNNNSLINWGQHSKYEQKRLTSIKFNHGHVEFIYKNQTHPNDLLERIEIYRSGEANPERIIRLTQSSYHSNSNRQNWKKLDKVAFYDSNDNHVKEYDLEYRTDISFPEIDNLSNGTTFAMDFWGYYNGVNNNNHLIPNFTFDPHSSGQNIFYTPQGVSDRDADGYYAQAGILKKITYPTGGTTEYTYEGNDAVGGVRIHQVKHKTGSDEIKRTYTYTGYSKSANYPYYVNQNISCGTSPPVQTFSVSSEPKVDLTFNGRPKLYTQVVEYLGDESTNNGRIEHTINAAYLNLPPSIDAWTVTKGVPWFEPGIYQYFYEYLTNYAFGETNESLTRVFNASGTLIQRTTNYYDNELESTMEGFMANRIVELCQFNGVHDKAYFFTFWNYDIKQYVQQLDSTVTETYLDQANPVVTREHYQYNGQLLLSEKKTKNSDAHWHITNYKYPFDFTGAPYTEMVSRNIIAPVVEQTNSKDATLLGGQKTNYKKWGSHVFAPEFLQIKKGANNYQDRVNYIYDNSSGNLSQVDVEDGMDVTYLWSYNGQYPVAKIENASKSQVETAVSNISSTFISQLEDNTSQTFIDQKLAQLRTEIANDIPSALLTTLTYDTLNGVATMMDPKGYQMQYEYDPYQRLQFIKDADGKLVSENGYNYKN